MKKAILILLFISVSFNLFAGHIIGYDMSLLRIGTTETYKVKLTLYRENGPGYANMPTSMNFKTFYQDLIISANVDFTVIRTSLYLAKYNSKDCIPSGSNGYVQVGVFEYTFTQNQASRLSDSSGYYFSSSICCRSLGAINVVGPSNNYGIVFSMDIPKLSAGITKYNSSPSFNKIPLLQYIVGNTYDINWNCTDIDGDSLSYSIVNSFNGVSDFPTKPFITIPFNTGYNLNTNIIDGAPDLTVNPTTGQIKFKPTKVGNYFLSFKVKEWRKISGVWKNIGSITRDVHFETVIYPYLPPKIIDIKKRSRIIRDTIYVKDSVSYINYFETRDKNNDSVFLRIEPEIGSIFNIFNTNLFNVKWGNKGDTLFSGISANSLRLGNIDSVKSVFIWKIDSSDIKHTPYKFKVISYDATCPIPLADTLNVELYITGICYFKSQFHFNGCDSINDIFGRKYFVSTATKDTIIGVIGCDTIITQYITVNHSYENRVESEGCDSVLGIDGMYYFKSDTIIQVFKTATNCDSTILQNIHVYNSPKANMILGDITISDPAFSFFYGTMEQPNINYTWSVLNGTILTGQGTNVIEVKWQSMGAGSITCVLSDSIGKCSDSSTLATTILTGLNNELASQIKIYPSPTNGTITIERLTANENTTVHIYNLNGQIILSETIKEKGQIDLSKLVQGVYIIKVGEVVKRVVRL